ncbi:MAG TPA: GntG family PLP-dependent aldolase [Flavobacteriales bacterium]|nr:GntG family PLP-dependent aldolase [Flavobacteriales bacterium]
MIDLRSDTVVKPTPGMRAAMAAAEVGDDVFGEDPTVNALEERLADLFGHEAGLYCSSGTQTNQIAIKVHTRPGDELIGDDGMHIYRYEGGGIMATSSCSVKFVANDRGRFTAAAVEAAINNVADNYLTRTRLVNIENSHNRGGGAVWELAEVERIRAVCSRHDLALHLDGARIFNAMVADGCTPRAWGKPFDSVSVCLSKGLGAPVGSVLLGSRPFILEARRVRKRIGGGMRQAGIIAAGAAYALDHHLSRLPEDHARAQQLADALVQLPYVAQVQPATTNIVVFRLHAAQGAAPLLAHLRQAGIMALPFGPDTVRFVTHLEVTDEAITRTIQALASYTA